MKAAIEMPTDFIAQQEYELLRVDFTSPEASGRVSSVQDGFPLWQAAYTIDVVGPDESDAFRAFMAQIRGATRRFLGRDLLRLYPKAHANGFTGMIRAGGGAFAGDATGWSEALTADGDSNVTLHGLPAGLTLSVGDYIDFRYIATDDGVAGLPWRVIVRAVEGAVADGTGDITVMCEPPIPSAVPGGAVAHLDNPACVMVLITDQSKLQAVAKRAAIQGGQILGVQDIRA